MAEPTMTSLVSGAQAGDRSAADALFATLYAELHRLARRQLKRCGPSVSLGVTTLLHEAYLDMAERTQQPSFPDRARFMAYAARVMRGLIIDYARNRQALKRGGGFEFTTLGAHVGSLADDRELLRISDAVDELAALDAPLAELVDLRFFCGCSFAEIAALRGVSERTVQRHWDKARIYLHRTLRRAGAPANSAWPS